MCQTALISSNIIRLGTRSYRQRMEAVVSNQYRVTQLARLNRDLDDFYELLYSQWNSVTEEDYNKFGGQLQIMLETLKDLFDLCKQMSQDGTFSKETEKLGMNYAAIYEMNSDMVNFKIKAKKDADLQQLMKRASTITSTIAS